MNPFSALISAGEDFTCAIENNWWVFPAAVLLAGILFIIIVFKTGGFL